MGHLAKGDERCRAVWIRHVEALCGARGVVLTPLRRQVLSLIATNPVPSTAYALLDRLGKLRGRHVSPPTVYRTLDFLVENGFVIRIESRNAFVPCGTPGRDRPGTLLICSRCGDADEVDDGGVVEATLSRTASDSGFRIEKQMVEILGICARCDAAARAGPLEARPTSLGSH